MSANSNTSPAAPSRVVFQLATLTRFNGRMVRRTIHAVHCPTVPEDGKVVDSSGVWRVSDLSGHEVPGLLITAEASGAVVLTSCRRCGGWPV